MSKIVDKFITTKPEELVGKLDPKRLKGIDLQDKANIMIVDTLGRYVKDPTKLLTQIVKIEDKLGSYISKFMDSPVGKLIKNARDMVTKGLSAIKDSGIIGPDGKLNLDALLDSGGKFLDSIGLGGLADSGRGILDTIKGGIQKLKDFGDAIGITEMIDDVKGWFNNAKDFFDALVPDFIKDIFKNLNWKAIFPHAEEDLLEMLQPTMDKIVDILGTDWIWYDKSRSLYSYDTLAAMNETTTRMLGYALPHDETLHNYIAALRIHYQQVERRHRAYQTHKRYN